MAIALPPSHRPAASIDHGHRAGTRLDEDTLHETPVQLPGKIVTLGMFVIIAIFYGYIGYRTTISSHVVVFDALDRLSRSYLTWHNDPPKLAAVGFVFPPITTMSLLPFAVVKPFATSLVALPVASACFASATIVMLDRVLARCEIMPLLRIPMLLAFGLNPYWLFYAGNGMSEVVYSFFLAFTLYAFVSWYATTEPRFLIAAGFGLSLLVLVRYAFIIWAALVAILIGVALIRRAARRIEVEGSVIAFAAPIVYVLGLWILFNTLIIGDPFGWITDTTTSSQAINGTGIVDQGSLGIDDVAKRLFQLALACFPLGLVAVPALVMAFVSQRNDMALWLAAFIVLGMVIIGVHAYTSDNQALLTMRDSMPMYVTAFVGAGWLYRSMVSFRLIVFAATTVILLLGMFTAWRGMQNYPFQSLEQAFTRALFSGDDQEGTSSRGGFTVGIASEARMADYINTRIPQKKSSILADDAQTFGVILLSGRPQNVFDRIDKGDTKFRQTLERPFGTVDYMLLTTNARSADIIRQRYPTAVDGQVPGLEVVFRTPRYALLKVARTAVATTTTTPGAAARPGGTATGATGTGTGTTGTSGTSTSGTTTTTTTSRPRTIAPSTTNP
ncbi:hypothetical protein DSM112329_05126 [Paraconexibacter sp. AEG42_29]|uniref:Glycosyltransferase RgtA/B/C/D-like domain-containing protein n=1 Tax=Paraconexibacter sp. AEG42_29 TaxID=2997339 RepID=A0AAU7B2P0_9ACTN